MGRRVDAVENSGDLVMMVQTNKWDQLSWGLRFSYSSNTLLSVKNNILDFWYLVIHNMYIWWCFGQKSVYPGTHLAVKHLEGSILTTTSYFTDKTNVVEVLSGIKTDPILVYFEHSNYPLSTYSD
jgi:hypothetical protein